MVRQHASSELNVLYSDKLPPNHNMPELQAAAAHSSINHKPQTTSKVYHNVATHHMLERGGEESVPIYFGVFLRSDGVVVVRGSIPASFSATAPRHCTLGEALPIWIMYSFQEQRPETTSSRTATKACRIYRCCLCCCFCYWWLVVLLVGQPAKHL